MIQLVGGLSDHIRLKRKRSQSTRLIGHEYIEIVNENNVKKDNECSGRDVGDNCRILVKDNGKKEMVINDVTLQIKQVSIPKDELVKVENVYKDG